MEKKVLRKAPMKERAKKTILVVDDSPSIRELLSALLENLGFKNIRKIESGYQAITSFKDLNPDITFLDMKMPRMGGLDTLKVMLKINPTAKIVLVTAFSKFEREVKEAIALGATLYLEKPIDRKKMLRVVEKLEREEEAFEGTSSLQKALNTIEKVMQAEDEEDVSVRFLIFEFSSPEEFNEFSLKISKLKNVMVRNLQVVDEKVIVTVSVIPEERFEVE
ncbi:MAG: response regulator [Candidatus Methanofastidiosia archaeon]